MLYWDFPGGPLERHQAPKAGDLGLIPDQGTRIPHAAKKTWQNQINKKKQILEKKKSALSPTSQWCQLYPWLSPPSDSSHHNITRLCFLPLLGSAIWESIFG